MSKFTKYSSIENAYRDKFINSITMHPMFPEVTWQVTEKLHGANFSFLIDLDADTIVACKRTSEIGEDKFYNHEEVFEKHKNTCYKIGLDINGGSLAAVGPSPISAIQIFGELYGKGVQKGVEYGEGQHFACFDIKVTWADGEEEYLDPNHVLILCNVYGLPHVPVLLEDVDFEEAMSVSPEFDSWICKTEGNLAEGVVLKPSASLTLHGGSRVIIKNKSESFSERSKAKKEAKPIPLDGEELALLESLMEYTNVNRLHNVISHIGKITIKDFGKVMGELSKDVMEDWLKDNQMPDWDKKHIKQVTKIWNKEVANLIRSDWHNIVDTYGE